MVFITEDLIRKRAEHNNCEISTLEEISLHQSDVEKIEHIGKWCRELKILYLQHNLIPKIENISKLKKLEYLNLALNNILHIENLEGCESLNKLDLTANFVQRATSVENLKDNEFLRDLYLTGNPCTDYVGYRDYVIATLPQLQHLDGEEISKSKRIEAVQRLSSLRCDMLRQEKIYLAKLEREKEEKDKEGKQGNPGFDNNWYTDTQGAHLQKEKKQKDDVTDENLSEDDFWRQKVKYTPESRLETYRYLQEKEKEKENVKSPFPDPNPPKRETRFFNDKGEPFNMNQGNVGFSLTEDEDNGCYVLDVACYKYLDTSLIDVDIQPTYVRVTIKGKILQIVLFQEVAPDKSSAQRSQTTGHLVLTMPKLNHIMVQGKSVKKSAVNNDNEGESSVFKENSSENNKDCRQNVERLEIAGNSKFKQADIFNIVKDEKEITTKSLEDILFSSSRRTKNVTKKDKKESEDEKYFVDNEAVPPLD